MAMTAGTSRQRCSGSDGQSQENLYDAEGLRCWVKENGRLSRFVYHQGEQLSTALLTDAAGRVRNHYRYDAFGGMLAGEEDISNRIRYMGQQCDETSGQYYLRARYYNPVVGRFLQEAAEYLCGNFVLP